jgi:L-glyceraldehyde 3-phosphate reductase
MQYNPWIPSSDRYKTMAYPRCGNSGLKLPALSLGLWHNFGGVDTLENQRAMLRRAFDLGITHFDLANNYGPPPGSAEENFGTLFREDFKPFRDELILSTKAGYTMWSGPYGEWGSRKYLLASLDQSLKRMGVDYVDIFYSHRFDPNTPLEETMGALDAAVRQGKALYVGISSYDPDQTARAATILKSLGTPCLIHQPAYSMLHRPIENGLLDVLGERGIGCIAFCPLAQGQLTSRYLTGVQQGSRAAKPNTFLNADAISPQKIALFNKLNDIALQRGQSLAQMALAWVLRDPRVTSALIGASRVEQIEENVKALANRAFSGEELQQIDKLLKA